MIIARIYAGDREIASVYRGGILVWQSLGMIFTKGSLNEELLLTLILPADIKEPERLFMYTQTGSAVSGAETETITSLLLNTDIYGPNISGANRDIPQSRLLLCYDSANNLADPILGFMAKVLMYGDDDQLNEARGRMQIPTANLLFQDDRPNNSVHPRIEMPKELLLQNLASEYSFGLPRLDAPRSILIWSPDFSTYFCGGKWDDPREIFMCSDNMKSQN